MWGWSACWNVSVPELPEVETIRRGLHTHLVGQEIVSVEGTGGRLVRNNPQGLTDLEAHLPGARVSGVSRRGKFMWLDLERRDVSLVIHLGMSGQVRVDKNPPSRLARHEHLRLTLSNGHGVRFIDPRTFGQLTISMLTVDPLGRRIPVVASGLAPDPLEDAPISTWIQPILRTRRPIKTVLLDQTVISGIGNIYADEALFRAGVSGFVPGNSLSDAGATSIVEGAREVMEAALRKGGTSFDSLYVDAEGNPGYFSRRLQVYKRAGKGCPTCGAPIRREVISGRSHFFCPVCQAPPTHP